MSAVQPSGHGIAVGDRSPRIRPYPQVNPNGLRRMPLHVPAPAPAPLDWLQTLAMAATLALVGGTLWVVVKLACLACSAFMGAS